ncbi:MAG: hypothetical protein ACRDDH_21215 [Cetobacterium sp.]|uniref:hypothetical protein n=1 Tax=Cetobacterium sp. TaxID=2071632 RepID=UPI003EE69E33
MTTEITLIETIRNSLTGDNMTALSTLLGLSGVSLRDLSGIGKIKNIFKKAAKDYPDGFEDEIVEGIFNDTIIELSEFLKNNHIDSQIFEKISNILFSGIKTKDLLTKEYIKIISNLSWVDLKVLILLPKAIYDYDNNFDNLVCLSYRKTYVDDEIIKLIIDKVKTTTNIPEELVQISLNKLEEYNLVSQIKIRTNNMISKEYFLTTSLGERVKKLLMK